MDKSNKNKLKVLHFLLQDVHACIELQYVNKVIPLVLLEEVPGSPHYLVGLMNLSGESIPVIDLTTRLGLKRHTDYSLTTPIIICANENNMFGVIVDKVLGLAEIDEKNLQKQDEFKQQHNAFFQGAATIGTDFSLLVNIKRIEKISLMRSQHEAMSEYE